MSITPVSGYNYSVNSLQISPGIYIDALNVLLKNQIGQRTGFDAGTEYQDIPSITPLISSNITTDATQTLAYLFQGNINQDLTLVVPSSQNVTITSSFFKMLPDSYLEGTVGTGGANVSLGAQNTTFGVASTTGAYTFTVGNASNTINISGAAANASSSYNYNVDWNNTVAPVTLQSNVNGAATTQKLTSTGAIVPPPEATFSFSTSSMGIVTSASSTLPNSAIFTTSTSTIVTDAAGNTLTFNISQNITQQHYASLVIPLLLYSSGTTITATTSLRYFWLTDSKGKYTFFISAIKTPTGRALALYTSLTNQTYSLSTSPSDDTDDLSLKTALLLLRQKLHTYSGLVIPSVSTNQGNVVVGY